MTIILNSGQASGPSFTDPLFQAAAAKLKAGDVFRWQNVYSEFTTANPVSAQFEGPFLRIYPESENFQATLVNGPYSTSDGRDVSQVSALNPRSVSVAGSLGTNESMQAGNFFYEIDALPSNCFVAPFDCHVTMVAYAPGYWAFNAGVERCKTKEIAAARVMGAASFLYSQTRWCNNVQNVQGLGLGVRRVAIPNGAIGLIDLGFRNNATASFDFMLEESPSTWSQNEVYINSNPGGTPGLIPTGNARFLLMRGITVTPERAGVSFQIRMV